MPRFTPRFTRLRLAAAIGALTLTLAGVAACGSTEPGATPIEQIVFNDTLKINLATFTKLPSGMYVKDSITGTGNTLSQGKAVRVSYVGYFPDGRIFDPGAAPLDFTIGAGSLIPGFEIGVQGMKVGGRRTLIIPPELGYGASGRGTIPPYAVLLFTVVALSSAP